jgi:uncharacterized protein (TIGR02145 family)
MKYYISLFLVLMIVNSACKKDEAIETIQLPIETSEMIDSRDGKRYKIVRIGKQWWMAENLNYYTPSGSWYYNNDSIYYAKEYGRLYLWQTIMAGENSSSANPSRVKGISPPGWHIPSDAEWTQLQDFLKTMNYDAHDLKDTSSVYWNASSLSTNKTSFNARSAGTVYNNGLKFANINGYTTFLSSTIDANTNAPWGRGLSFDKATILRAPLGKENGWSVRCVKDN